MTPIYAFLHRQLAVPFAWGGHGGGADCMLFLADWYQDRRGTDPADGLRYCYDSAATCHRVTGWLRDPLPVVRRIAEDVGGLSFTRSPRRGDVALVRTEDRGRLIHCGAICLGQSWAIKTEGQSGRGICTRDGALVDVVAAWNMEYRDA